MNYSNFIAALDIGSSKITLTIATRTTSGEINVIDAESTPTSSVKYGCITNEKAVAKEIQSLVLKIQQRHGSIIEKVYVTTGGALLQSESNTVVKELGEGSIITDEVIKGLHESNYTIDIAPADEILDVRPISYKIDGETTENIEGRVCHMIEATFLIIKGRKDALEKIKRTLQVAEIQMADMYLSPLAIADTTLNDREKTLGTASVEIGKASTKMAIYQADKLRFVTTIPLGTQLITSDLSACLDIHKETAELLKQDKNFGAVCANLVEDADLLLKMTNGIKKNFSSRKIVEIIEARVEEILLNIMHQIEKSGYMYLLSGGLVISGNITETKNLTQFVKMKTNLNARIADIKTLLSDTSVGNTHTPESAETCGMLVMGQANCKKEEKIEKKQEEVQPEPKKKRSIRKGMGDLFAGFFDENDDSID